MNTPQIIRFVLGFYLIRAAISQTMDSSKLRGKQHEHTDLDPDDKGLQDFYEMTRRAGLLMYKVHEFEFYPEVSWKDLARNASKSEPVYLHDISDDEIDKIFNLKGTITKYMGPSMKYDVHSFEVSAKDLFPASTEWSLENNGKSERIKPDGDIVISNAKEVRLVGKSKDRKNDVNILFDLGPKFEMMRHIMFSEIRSGHLQKGVPYDMIMSHPRLEIIVKGGVGKIKYKVSLHVVNESMNFPLTQGQMEGDRAFQIITNLTHYILSHPDLVEKVSQRHLGITYAYQDIIVSMTDYGFQTFLSNWTSRSSDKSVKINVYGAMKTALTNPLALFRFNKDGDLIHKHHEVDFGGLHTPKGMDFNRGLFPGFIYSGSNTDNPELENWITKRVMNISKTIHEEGIHENKLGDIRVWMQNMIREDFRKFRMGQDNITFHVHDEHFAAQTILKENDETRLFDQEIKGLMKNDKQKDKRHAAIPAEDLAFIKV